jgi:uroporphyrinogen decarboxylase
LNSRERVLRAINFKDSDRVPIDFGGTIVTSITRKAYTDLVLYLDWHDLDEPETMEICQDIIIPAEKIKDYFCADFKRVALRPPSSWKLAIDSDDSFINEWGIKFKRFGYYYDIVDFPIKEPVVEIIEKYPWPDPADQTRYVRLREEAKELREAGEYAVIADMFTAGVFFHAMRMRGFEQFMGDLAMRPQFAMALMEKLVELYEGFYQNYLDAVGNYVDIVAVADDLGTQKSLMLSPRMYREMIKPFHKRLYSYIKNRTDAKLLMHSDGAIEPLIDDFIDVGVDILDPIQTSAQGMVPSDLKKKYGSKIVFYGAIDVQTVLSQGTPEEVEAEVYRMINTLGHGGGYVLGATHNIQPDCSPANVVKLYRSAQNYKKN